MVEPGEYAGETLLLFVDLLKERKAEGRRGSADADGMIAAFELYTHQMLRIDDRQTFQTNRVDQLKNRGVDSDAERERQNRGTGEAWVLAQRTQREAQILKRGLGPRTFTCSAEIPQAALRSLSFRGTAFRVCHAAPRCPCSPPIPSPVTAGRSKMPRFSSEDLAQMQERDKEARQPLTQGLRYQLYSNWPSKIKRWGKQCDEKRAKESPFLIVGPERRCRW